MRRSRLLGAVAGLVLLCAVPSVAAGAPRFGFVQIASGLSDAVYVTSAPDDPATLYVVEQSGVVETVRDGHIVSTFLDIRPRVSFDGERGLLSIAFHPSYARNHLFYVDYTDAAGDIHVVEYSAANGVATLSSARELLDVVHPWPNHNGGQLQFDRAGRLWFGIGDGGTDPTVQGASLGDPENHAQDPATRLGKLLRIDPTAPHAVWKTAGVGLRNPWRFSFDRRTGDLWIGDVGAATEEEVDFRPAAKAASLADFGWSRLEGRLTYNPKVHLLAGLPLVAPLWIYSHRGGSFCAVVGGYVYRGSSVPAANGLYFFGDYCAGTVWTLRRSKGHAVATMLDGRLPSLTSFGEASDGALYAVTSDGNLYELR